MGNESGRMVDRTADDAEYRHVLVDDTIPDRTHDKKEAISPYDTDIEKIAERHLHAQIEFSDKIDKQFRGNFKVIIQIFDIGDIIDPNTGGLQTFPNGVIPAQDIGDQIFHNMNFLDATILTYTIESEYMPAKSAVVRPVFEREQLTGLSIVSPGSGYSIMREVQVDDHQEFERIPNHCFLVVTLDHSALYRLFDEAKTIGTLFFAGFNRFTDFSTEPRFYQLLGGMFVRYMTLNPDIQRHFAMTDMQLSLIHMFFTGQVDRSMHNYTLYIDQQLHATESQYRLTALLTSIRDESRKPIGQQAAASDQVARFFTALRDDYGIMTYGQYIEQLDEQDTKTDYNLQVRSALQSFHLTLNFQYFADYNWRTFHPSNVRYGTVDYHVFLNLAALRGITPRFVIDFFTGFNLLFPPEVPVPSVRVGDLDHQRNQRELMACVQFRDRLRSLQDQWPELYNVFMNFLRNGVKLNIDTISIDAYKVRTFELKKDNYEKLYTDFVNDLRNVLKDELIMRKLQEKMLQTLKKARVQTTSDILRGKESFQFTPSVSPTPPVISYTYDQLVTDVVTNALKSLYPACIFNVAIGDSLFMDILDVLVTGSSLVDFYAKTPVKNSFDFSSIDVVPQVYLFTITFFAASFQASNTTTILALLDSSLTGVYEIKNKQCVRISRDLPADGIIVSHNQYVVDMGIPQQLVFINSLNNDISKSNTVVRVILLFFVILLTFLFLFFLLF